MESKSNFKRRDFLKTSTGSHWFCGCWDCWLCLFAGVSPKQTEKKKICLKLRI